MRCMEINYSICDPDTHADARAMFAVTRSAERGGGVLYIRLCTHDYMLSLNGSDTNTSVFEEFLLFCCSMEHYGSALQF